MNAFFTNTGRLCLGLFVCCVLGNMGLQAGNDGSPMPAPHIDAAVSAEYRAGLERSNPYKRLVWFGEQRMDADGNIYSAEYLDAAQRHVNSKRAKARPDGILAEDVWTPVGPLNQPPSLLDAPVSGMGRTNCIVFHPTDPDVFLVGASSGGIWETRTGGASWTPRGDDLASLRLGDLAIDPRTPNLIYAATGDKDLMLLNHSANGGNANFASGLWRSLDAGITWERTSLGGAEVGTMSRILIHPDNSALLTAAGSNGVFISEDAGQTWTRSSDQAVFDLERDPRNGNVLHAATAFGIRRIMYSTDAGRTWQFRNLGNLQDNSVLRIELALAPSNPDIIYAVRAQQNTAFHSLLRSDDGGLSWVLQSSIADNVNIFGYFNGSPLFSDMASGQAFYNLALFVDPADAERVFVGAINIWGSDDGGETFNMCSFWQDAFGQSVNNDHHEITHNPLDGKVYVLHDGGVDVTEELEIGSTSELTKCFKGSTLPGLFSPNSECYTLPTKWTNLNSGLAISEFYRIMLIPGQDEIVLGGAQDNGSYMHSMEGWQLVYPGDGGDGYIHREKPSTFLVTLQYGGVLKTSDAGRNYRNVNQAWAQDPLQEKPFLTNLYEHPGDADVVFAPLSDLYRSDNTGDTWTKLSSFPPARSNVPSPAIRSMVIAPSNPDVMYLSKRPIAELNISAQVYRSQDGGVNWTELNSDNLPPFVFYNDMAIDANDADRIWLVCSHLSDGKKVYTSQDGGATWENISYDLPNVPMNAIEHHSGPNGGITYVGSDFGVFYRKNDMLAWQPLGQGLPQIPVNDLEINSASGILYAGTFGRGIWKTSLLSAATVAVNESTSKVADGKLAISPNPANELISLRGLLNTPGKYTLEIVDAAGRPVLTTEILHEGGELLWEHSAGTLVSGTYYLRIHGHGASRATRFVLKQ